jgi:ribonuclease P protein component
VLWCTFVLDPSVSPPEVAFAIGRAIGPAVTRNTLRRRLRAMLRECSPPAGLYLIGATPAAASRSYGELVSDMTTMLSKLDRRTPA